MRRSNSHRTWSRSVLALLAVGGASIQLTCQPARTIILISRGLEGGYANNHCYLPNISPDGRYVVFECDASNLVPGDTNGKRDVFLYDVWSDSLSRVSVGEGGEQGNDWTAFASINQNARYIGFAGRATNLVPGDTNGKGDAFVRDIQTGQNLIVSRSAGGGLGNDASSGAVISQDGRYAAIISAASNLVEGDTNSLGAGIFSDIFVHDMLTGENERVSLAYDGGQPNGSFTNPIDMTPDGRYVLFRSKASNLVLNDTNGLRDLFLHDRVTHLTERVNVGPQGQQDDRGISPWNTPHITPDGRYLVFSSSSTTFTPEYRVWQVFVRDRLENTTEWIKFEADPTDGYHSEDPDISEDGRYVVFDSFASGIVPDDWDGMNNIFRFDRQTGEIILVDRDLDGTIFRIGLDPSISADGKTIAFESTGPPGDTPYSQIYVAIGLP